MNANSMHSMRPELRSTAPALRLVFAIAALSATFSVGGLIDFLATDYAVADAQSRAVIVAEQKAA